MDFRRRIYALKGRIQPESLNKTESVRFIVRFWIYKWLEQCLFFSFPRGLVGEKLKTCKLFVFLKLPFCSNHSRRNPWKNRKHKDHFQQRLKLRVIKSFYENFRKSLKAKVDDKVWGKVVHREIKLQFWKSMTWEVFIFGQALVKYSRIRSDSNKKTRTQMSRLLVFPSNRFPSIIPGNAKSDGLLEDCWTEIQNKMWYVVVWVCLISWLYLSVCLAMELWTSWLAWASLCIQIQTV